MIALDGVQVRSGAFRLNRVSFEIPAGGYGVLMGKTGSGKTTILEAICGLRDVDAGRVSLAERDVTQLRPADRGIGYVPQDRALFQTMTVRQNLAVYARLYGVPDAKARIGALAADLDIEPLLDRETGKLSSGQKTRVALAKALINSPELLLLDEPTASLDPDTADWVRGYLEKYQKETGCAVLLASHNMSEVERLASVVLMMKAGLIVDRGSPGELIARYGRTNMEDVFLDIARNRRGPDGTLAAAS